MSSIEQRTALVVGGTGGIGARVTTQLARRGLDLYVHGGHSRQALAQTLATGRECGVRAHGELCTFEHADDARDLPARAAHALGAPVDVLVVTLGPYLAAPLGQTTVEQWRSLVELNLVLPAVLVGSVLPSMVARGGGRIVLFGGPRADRLDGYRLIGAYAAAKAGVVSLARSIALQHAVDGVQANVVSPGFVATEYLDETEIERGRRTSPTRRLIEPEHVAHVVAYLVCEAGDAVNGTVISVGDGL